MFTIARVLLAGGEEEGLRELRQALGAPGLLLGWSPSLKRKVRSTAAGNLKKFLAQG